MAEHAVQFYETDAYLVESVREFARDALRSGQGVILVATSAHLRPIERLLEIDGLDLDGARTAGRYLTLDATEALAGLLVEGAPSPEEFRASIGQPISAMADRVGRVAVFGEMVALLAEAGDYARALALEAIWNDFFASESRFALYCAYPIRLDQYGPLDFHDGVTAAHATIIPYGSSPGGRPLQSIETAQVILASAPAGVHSTEFLLGIGGQLGVARETMQAALQTLEVTGDVARDEAGRWLIRR